MGNIISKIYVGTNQVRPVETPTHTFDFQNDGSLNWTAQSIYGTPTLVTGEGWTIGTPNESFQSAIMPPNSVYDGNKLIKRKLRIYKGVATYYGSNLPRSVGAGIATSSLNPSAMWEQPRGSDGLSYANVYDGSDHSTSTTGKTGELVLEYIFNDDGSLVLSVDGTNYNLGQYATTFRNQWTNQNLGINIGRWNVADGNIYIRKVEIYTE